SSYSVSPSWFTNRSWEERTFGTWAVEPSTFPGWTWNSKIFTSANAMPVFCSFTQTSRSFPCFIALETRSYAASNLPSLRACKYRRTVSSGESGDGPATAARTTTRSASAPSTHGDQRARGMEAPYHRPPAGRKLAWKAIHGLAHKRGVADDVLRRSPALADG